MQNAEKFLIVLFGATGDLAGRKLLPALFDLWRDGRIDNFAMIATGRRIPDRASFERRVENRVEDAQELPDQWREFEKTTEYLQFDAADGYEGLRDAVRRVQSERGLPNRVLFYLSVAPRLFAPIVNGIAEIGLLRRAGDLGRDEWHRLIVEKPFGHDLESARSLDESLKRHIDESQIYRIDHYLGKETVQNLIAFRFANGLIEPLWNRKHVESITITVAESGGVGDRAGYYDKAGALRDVVQNHMMQLLALTAMEPPLSLAPDDIRNEKVRALRSIQIPDTPREVAESTVRGQYGAGSIAGEQARAYRDESGVAPGSTTPTFVAAKITLGAWRWVGVPFYLVHGKRLPRRATEIVVRFQNPPLLLFQQSGCDPACTNELVIRIQPDEGIRLRIGAKRPGPGMNIEDVDLGFTYAEEFHEELPAAYERLLLDALNGDPTLFLRQDEVEASWRWADAIQRGWDSAPPPEFPNYDAGSSGPPKLLNLLNSAANEPQCLVAESADHDHPRRGRPRP